MPESRGGGTNTLHAMVMAALVVAAALVVGYVVFDLQVDVLPGDPQPEASFGFAYDDRTQRLVVTHRGGDTLDPERVVVLNQGFERIGGWPDDDPITAGDTMNATGVDPNDTVYVMWVTEDGGYVELASWSGGGGETPARGRSPSFVIGEHAPMTTRTATFLLRME